MLLKIPSTNIFHKDYGWHIGRFHFEFGDYQDSANQPFGVLYAFNDFLVRPKSGFETHPHSEMEIISYCVSGSLKHQDNMGEVNYLQRGDSQYTCTGSGITHSEMNEDSSTPVRFLQIWIKPMQAGLKPFHLKKNTRSLRATDSCAVLFQGIKQMGQCRSLRTHMYLPQKSRRTNLSDMRARMAGRVMRCVSFDHCGDGKSIKRFLLFIQADAEWLFSRSLKSVRDFSNIHVIFARS
ncbi:MAG: pirin family protein [Pelolinea sp.]|nr:pirin family protein [Pelolinea sp.]